jgi:hypothetical protein
MRCLSIFSMTRLRPRIGCSQIAADFSSAPFSVESKMCSQGGDVQLQNREVLHEPA